MPRQKWEFAIELDRRAAQPLFLQIARTIVDEICRGRLKPGDPLPGTRTLAESLGVNRVTALTAYDELTAEGWVTTHPARGSFVSAELPEDLRLRPANRVRPWDTVPYPLPAAPPVERSPEHLRGFLVFGGSSPDTRLVQVEPLARAYGRVLRRGGGALLGYSNPEGHPRLRTAIAGMLAATRGIAANADNIFITRGSQMALALTARAILRRGDVVAVEALGYRHAWECFRAAGAKLIPVAVDEQGLDVDALASIPASRRISAVYVTPHHQFPTTVTLAPSRRLQLLELARVHKFAIIEDDYDHEFHYDGRPVLPLASLDRAGVVIYIGTFSKVLAPGLRMGYVAGPPALLQRMGAHREFLDMQGDYAVEAAVAELLEDGEVQRHVRRVRRVYRARRDLLADLLERTFSGQVQFSKPAGGIALWIRAPDAVDVDAWCDAAMQLRVGFQTARAFSFDKRPRPFARLGYASLDDEQLHQAVERLAQALDRVAAPARPSRRS